MVCEPHFHCVYLKSEWIHSAFLCLFHLDLPLCVCIEFMQCFRYNVQQRTATELPSRLYVAVWQMRFFQTISTTQHRLHGIINLFGSKLCVLAFFIHTKESKLQKGKHKCIFVYTLQMLVACHCEWKKRKERKIKTNAIAKRKMYGIEITIQWAKYTAFRQEFHVSSTSVTCSLYGSVRVCCGWIEKKKSKMVSFISYFVVLCLQLCDIV